MTNLTEGNAVASTLELDSTAPPPFWHGRNVSIAVAVLLTITLWLLFGRDNEVTEYETAAAVRGDLLIYVTATGALQPTNQVEVGIEVSGTIATVEVDFNDQVEAGQVLARLDTAKLSAQVLQARATLESARARLLFWNFDYHRHEIF